MWKTIFALACIAGLFLIASGWLNPVTDQIARFIGSPFGLIFGGAISFALVVAFIRGR